MPKKVRGQSAWPGLLFIILLTYLLLDRRTHKNTGIDVMSARIGTYIYWLDPENRVAAWPRGHRLIFEQIRTAPQFITRARATGGSR